ncbi:MAG: peptidylprolyl isomerase [Vicinamibacterales bacterium]
MRSKVFLCVCLLATFVGACRKAPAGQAGTTAATPAGSATPAAAAPGAPGQPPAATPPKPVPATLPAVIARVNGEDVKKEEFDRIIHTMEARAGQPIPPERRDEILRGAIDQLVVYKLLSQESSNRGIKIADTEIDAKMAQLRSQFPTQDKFEAALKERGMTVDGLRKDARIDLSVTKLMEAETGAMPGPSDVEAKEFYEKNPDRFKQDESVRASHILVRVDEKADAAAKKKARAEIDAVLKQVKAGGDFAKLAQEHSQDSSASQGGDLNYFPKGQMVPAFDKVAFELKPGLVSDVVTTQFGYHIIKVIDHKPSRVVPFDESSQQIKQFLGEQKKQQHTEAFIESLKKKSKIEVLV